MKAMVISDSLPETEVIKKSLKRIDYWDTFSTTNHKDEVQKVTFKIFGQAPTYVRKLFALRNFLVRFVGIRVENKEPEETPFVVGGRVKFFKIFSIEKNEVLLGLDDAHLNFRVSVYNSEEVENNIKVTTLVEFNNLKGKLYFSVIKPFHKMIVKSMLKQAYLKN